MDPWPERSFQNKDLSIPPSSKIFSVPQAGVQIPPAGPCQLPPAHPVLPHCPHSDLHRPHRTPSSDQHPLSPLYSILPTQPSLSHPCKAPLHPLMHPPAQPPNPHPCIGPLTPVQCPPSTTRHPPAPSTTAPSDRGVSRCWSSCKNPTPPSDSQQKAQCLCSSSSLMPCRPPSSGGPRPSTSSHVPILCTQQAAFSGRGLLATCTPSLSHLPGAGP